MAKELQDMKPGALFSSLILYLLLSLTPAHATIKVGIVMFFPPFVMNDGEGFDVDFIRILCQRLQQDCQLSSMNFSKLFTALNQGDIDIAIGGITIPQDRDNLYLYSLPYMLSKGAFMVLKSSKYKHVNNVYGKTLGIIKGRQDGGVFFNYIISNYPGKFQIQLYDTMGDLISALNQGQVAAVFIHESTTIYWQQNGAGAFATLDKPEPVGDGIAIAALPKSQALIIAINQQIENIEQNQVYINLYNTYFGNER